MITVVNKSTLVSDDDVKTMTRACAAQLRLHAAPLWGRWVIPVVYSSTEADAPSGAWVIAILDDPDQADALGWHTESQGELIFGRVFARPVLDNGGDALTRSLSVASVLSHEVLVSNFVGPRWFDPQSNAGDRFDYMGTAKEAFRMTPGGYIVVLKEGKISQQYGERYPAWRKELKRIDVARTARRLSTG